MDAVKEALVFKLGFQLLVNHAQSLLLLELSESLGIATDSISLCFLFYHVFQMLVMQPLSAFASTALTIEWKPCARWTYLYTYLVLLPFPLYFVWP